MVKQVHRDLREVKEDHNRYVCYRVVTRLNEEILKTTKA
jgi:hypothetical protein